MESLNDEQLQQTKTKLNLLHKNAESKLNTMNDDFFNT